jgi:RNA polymerase-binding transcription factor DksA
MDNLDRETLIKYLQVELRKLEPLCCFRERALGTMLDGGDDLEKIFHLQEKDRDAAVANVFTDKRRLILSTLDKLQEGYDGLAYGCCERCEEEIAAIRLKKTAWVAFCIECQEVLDAQKKAGISNEGGFFGTPATA